VTYRPEPPHRADLPGEDCNAAQRGETEHQRLDRNFTELLAELRVAQTGVQILFGFLLALAFTQRFSQPSSGQRTVYLVATTAAAPAAAPIIAPAARHRPLFRRRRKAELVSAGDRMAPGVLARVLISVAAAAVFLIVDVAAGRTTAVLLATAVGCWYPMLCCLAPLCSLHRDPRR
jgi:Family of unknown function (DUF6328)